MPAKKPFLDFYREHKISPVRQDISNLSRHFTRREALYRHLGIVPSLIKGKHIIEFGPGSGHNAIFTASLQPEKYVLVDGNTVGLESTRENINAFYSKSVNKNTEQKGNTIFEFIESEVQDFTYSHKFDIVLAEGLVQLQIDPSNFARKIASFTKNNGILVLTTCDCVSFLSETLRRLLGSIISSPGDNLEKRINDLLPVFSSHAKTLKGMSRPVEDWLIDTIIIPFEGSLFSISDAINSLGNNFDFYSSSPNFTTDWRWYKDINSPPLLHNENATEIYLSNLHNFLDYRYLTGARDPKENEKLHSLSRQIFDMEQKYEKDPSCNLLKRVLDNTLSISDNIREIFPETSIALVEFVNEVAEIKEKGKLPEFKYFKSLFGRGMQYVSFIKR